jgi:hypothetical protein
MQNLYLRYTSFTMLYGAIHTAIHTPTHSKYTDKNTGERAKQPVLLTHRLLNILIGCGAGPFVWPAMVYDDLTIAECTLRGVNHAKYGTLLHVDN